MHSAQPCIDSVHCNEVRLCAEHRSTGFGDLKSRVLDLFRRELGLRRVAVPNAQERLTCVAHLLQSVPKLSIAESIDGFGVAESGKQVSELVQSTMDEFQALVLNAAQTVT